MSRGLRPVDVALLAYAAVSGAVVAVGGPPAGGWLLAARGALAVGLVALARAATRPDAPPSTAVRVARGAVPLLACPLFFWEAPRLAPALWDGRWWFEPSLRGVDVALFGAPSTPAAFPLTDPGGEVLWLLYFAYYPLVAAGLALAWAGPRRHAEPGGPAPAAAFEPVLTAAVLGFLGAYVLFPFLPARAPIHAIGGVAPASGGAFGAAVGWVQSWGGVTGGAFPSAHVSAAWAIALGIAPDRPRAGVALGIVAAGMTVACVYTPYHWAADVGAGLALGIGAAVAGRRLARGRPGGKRSGG